MRKTVCILIALVTFPVMAQNGFGLIGGLNYGDNGEVAYTDVTNAGEDIMKGADSKMGYHLGVFYRAELASIFLKPELLYTQTKSSYEINNEESDYEISKLDLPILLGVEVLGPLHVFAGPSLQYILDNQFEGVTLGDVEEEFSVGAQFGAGIKLGNLGLDVRYERGLKENEAQALDEQTGIRRVDSRPSQLIFSLSLNL